MADQQNATPAPGSEGTGKSFADMTMGEKLTFLGKAIVMLCTGGFAFPNVFVE